MARRNGSAHPPRLASIHPNSLLLAASDPSSLAFSNSYGKQLPRTSTEWHVEDQTQSEIEGVRSKTRGGLLSDLLNFAVPNTRRADLQPFAGAVDKGAHRLEVDIPATLGDVMSVADAVAELRPATAYFTNLCHKTKIS